MDENKEVPKDTDNEEEQTDETEEQPRDQEEGHKILEWVYQEHGITRNRTRKERSRPGQCSLASNLCTSHCKADV